MLLGFDLGHYPITYDFVYWLVRAEEARVKIGAESLGVIFQPGEVDLAEGFRLKTMRDFQLTADRKRWRLENLLVPLAHRIPSVSTVQISPVRIEKLVTPHFNIFDDIHKTDLCPFRASGAARAAVDAMYPKRYVTITLRDSDVQPERNSDQAQWAKVADWLRGHGLEPVVVPDTEAVMRGTPQTVCEAECVPAAMNVDIRMALYELAEFNLFTSGGPMALAQFMDCRYATFKMVCGTWTADHLTAVGIEDGSNRGPFRETHFCADTYMNVVQHVERYLKIVSNREIRPVLDAQTHFRGHLIQPAAYG